MIVKRDVGHVVLMVTLEMNIVNIQKQEVIVQIL